MRSRWSTETKSSSAASRSAISPVPSGELSSITSTRTPSGASARSIDLEVLALVVRRQADDCVGHGVSGYGKTWRRDVRSASWPRCPRTPTSPSSSTCLPTCSSSRAPSRFACSPIAAPQRGCARRRARSRSSRSTAGKGAAGNRQDDRGEDRPDRRDRARSRRSTKRKAGVPPDVVLFMRLPGLGPKTAARIWQELGISTLDELKAAAEAEQLRALPGLGAKSEEKILKALAFQAENPDEGRRLLGDGLPAVQAVVAVLREHPAAVHVSEAGSVRRRKETFRDLDIIATATDPAELTRVLHAAAVGGRRRRARRHEGDRAVERRACASTCASCRPSRTATCCSTSRARRSTTSRCARTQCGAGSRSRSTA